MEQYLTMSYMSISPMSHYLSVSLFSSFYVTRLVFVFFHSFLTGFIKLNHLLKNLAKVTLSYRLFRGRYTELKFLAYPMFYEDIQATSVSSAKNRLEGQRRGYYINWSNN